MSCGIQHCLACSNMGVCTEEVGSDGCQPRAHSYRRPRRHCHTLDSLIIVRRQRTIYPPLHTQSGMSPPQQPGRPLGTHHLPCRQSGNPEELCCRTACGTVTCTHPLPNMATHIPRGDKVTWKSPPHKHSTAQQPRCSGWYTLLLCLCARDKCEATSWHQHLA